MRINQVSQAKRGLFGLVISMLALAVVVQPVLAVGPVREKLEFPPTGSFEGICDFTVDYTIVQNNEYTLTYFDASGKPVRLLTQGRLVVTMANASNPSHSMTVNISGPGWTTYNADGSLTITFLGRSAIFLDGQIMLSSGRAVVVASDPLAVGILLLAAGNQSNLCATLA
jgi:hypothetical protein